jgi:hypothetical protein
MTELIIEKRSFRSFRYNRHNNPARFDGRHTDDVGAYHYYISVGALRTKQAKHGQESFCISPENIKQFNNMTKDII